MYIFKIKQIQMNGLPIEFV